MVGAQTEDDFGPTESVHGHGEGTHGSLTALTIGAMGIVFGDIGTSPLYALKETFAGHHPMPADLFHVYGVLSLVFWTFLIVVTFKYVSIVMRADNKGEGGSLALLALVMRKSPQGRSKAIVMLAVVATALFFGDAIITPAISVLSAVEGLTIVEARLSPLVLPIAVGILIALFVVQSRGTAAISRYFGPIMVVYFAVLAGLGVFHIIQRPDVLAALSPHHAALFFARDPGFAFLALGSVVLAVTGAEALYADMGHFGRKPIVTAWLYVVFPSLILNYLGQCALLLTDPAAVANPFYFMAPENFRLPLVILATLATIIASQALITGVFSVVKQAVQLGFMPRVQIEHTSATAAGQIYVPIANWALMVAVILLVLTFQASTNLAAAYGLAVTGTMLITTCLIGILAHSVWNWPWWRTTLVIGLFVVVDVAYFAANVIKIPDGGWLPLLVGLVLFTLLTTWSRGRELMRERMAESAIPMEVFIKSTANSATRVPGTAVFMASAASGVPSAMLHNIKHNKILHERILVLTVQIQDMPYVDEADRIVFKDLGEGFYRIKMRFGFLEETNIPLTLAKVDLCGPKFDMMQTSFFLSRQTLIASKIPGMAIWREKIFAWMLRNSASAMSFFGLPTNRVVELGSQVEI